MRRSSRRLAAFVLITAFSAVAAVAYARPVRMDFAISYAWPPLVIDERAALLEIEGLPPLPAPDEAALPSNPYDRLHPQVPRRDRGDAWGGESSADISRGGGWSFDLAGTLLLVGVVLLVAAPLVAGLAYVASRRRSFRRRFYSATNVRRRRSSSRRRTARV